MTTFEHIKLKYELLRLENIVLIDLFTFIQDGSEPDEWLITDFRSELREEIEKIKQNLNQAMLYFDRKNARQAYVRYHQQGLIKLAGSLVNYVNPRQLNVISESPSVQLLTYLIYASLEDLLTFIETHLSKYFDPEAWIPPSYLRIVLYDISSTIDDTSKNLNNRGLDRDLFKTATQPLRDFINDDLANDVTYRQVIYFKQLNKELLYISKQASSDNVNRSVRTMLHELNFNSQDYFTYCIKYIRQELKEVEGSTDDEIRILAKFSRYLHQVQEKPGFTFNPNLPSLREFLADWIQVEAEYVQTGSEETETSGESSPGMFSHFKVAIDMSIGELSYFISVLIAIKIIQNKNKSALFRFITVFFQTNHTDDIANKSMRKKSYRKNNGIRSSVRKILERSIKYIDSDTGEFGRK